MKGITNSVLQQNLLYILLLVFLGISALSLFVGINTPQGLLSLSTMATMVCMAFVFFLLLYNQRELFNKLILVLLLVTLYESFSALSYLFKNIASGNTQLALRDLGGNFNNQNIFSFSLVVKMPLVVYAFIYLKNNYLKVLAAVTLWLAFLTIFFCQTRAAFLAVIGQVALLIIGLGFIHLRKKENRQFLIKSAVILGLYVSSVGVYQMVYNGFLKKSDAEDRSFTENVAQRSIEEEIRIKYWKYAIDNIGERPFLGHGVGNYELYIPQYYSQLTDRSLYSRHPHNEFLNIAAESGVVNGLIYLSFFIIATILTFKVLLADEKRYSQKAKIIAVVTLTALAGYFIDAFFNFPLGRPPMQVLFALLLAAIAGNYLYKKEGLNIGSSTLIKPILIGFLIIGVGTVYINYQLYSSYKVQSKMMSDLSNLNDNPKIKLRYSYDELVKEIPNLPNLAADTEPIGFKLARYLYQEGRKEEALKLLDSTQVFTPYTGYNSYLKSDIYNSQKKKDSAFKYAKKAYLLRPRNLNYYKTACAMAVNVNDKEALDTFYKTYFSYERDSEKELENESAAFFTYLASLIKSKSDIKKIKELVDEGAKKYPDHKALQSLYKKLNPTKKKENKGIKIIRKNEKKKKIERKGDILIIRK